MQFTVDSHGEQIHFECANTLVSRWVCGEILEDKTYPYLPFVEDVQVIFDVGANCGATSVHLARRYPDAVVHAFEPGSEPWAYLERNAAAYPNIRTHRIGLHSVDQELPLFRGDGDSILGSVLHRSVNLAESEVIQLRAAGAWAAEHGIDRIDVLKVDVEGCEIDVLESLAPLLPTTKVLYLEYDSRGARRAFARLLDATHELYKGTMFLDQGECIYVRHDIADHPDANPHLLAMLRNDMAGAAGGAPA